jgi:hypothetical protein
VISQNIFTAFNKYFEFIPNVGEDIPPALLLYGVVEIILRVSALP